MKNTYLFVTILFSFLSALSTGLVIYGAIVETLLCLVFIPVIISFWIITTLVIKIYLTT